MRTSYTRVLKIVVLLCFSLVCSAPARAQLSSEEGSRLRMVYFAGTESYLVPYAAKTFFNSLAFQARLLGYEPDTDITILLADFEDFGNAGVSVVPRSTMLVQISPLSFASAPSRNARTLSTKNVSPFGKVEDSAL